MSQITTHVLDTARGCAAAGIAITLCKRAGEEWQRVGSGHTDDDGRISDLCPSDTVLEAGTYRMHFATGAYFHNLQVPVFYPWAEVVFCIDGDGQHYHIPLLLAGYGYSTYRGS